jgi:hypothetical protein
VKSRLQTGADVDLVQQQGRFPPSRIRLRIDRCSGAAAGQCNAARGGPPMAEPEPEPEQEPQPDLAPVEDADEEGESDEEDDDEDEVEELQRELAELRAASAEKLLEAQAALAKSEQKRATLEALLDERTAEVQEQIDAKKRLGDEIASYLRAAGARRGHSSSEVKLLQTELRSARAKARAMAEDSLELQLRFQRKSSEAKEHSNKRMWLEKRLSKATVRINSLEDGLRELQEIHRDTVAEKQKFATELGRTKLRLAESELTGDRLRQQLNAAQEKSDMIGRQLKKIGEEVENGANDLSALGPGQDARVTNLREKLKAAHDARSRAGRAQADLDVQTDSSLQAKAQEHREEMKRMTAEVREGDTVMMQEDATARDPAEELLAAAEERPQPQEIEEVDPDELREELRAGIREVDMQRQLLGWAGVALDEDANALLEPSARTNDIAQRAVASLLMYASLIPIGGIMEEQVETLADTGIVLAFHNARSGKEPLKFFSPNQKGLPRLYTELEQLTVHGYYTPEERKRRAKATATFQAMLRIKRALKAFRQRQREKLEHDSATVINAHSRGHLGRKMTIDRRQEVARERRREKRARDLARAEQMIEEALGTDDDEDDGDAYDQANHKLRRANRSYRHLIRGLPVAAVAHLSANAKHGPLYGVLMQAVMGQRDYQRRLKKYKRLRNNGNQAGGWATLDDDDDSPSAQAVLRERIWQLESDVSALLLVDARRRLADRRQTLIDSNKGKAIASHQKYAQETSKPLSRSSLAQAGGSRPTTAPYLTSPEPTYRPPSSARFSASGAVGGGDDSEMMALATTPTGSLQSSRSV